MLFVFCSVGRQRNPLALAPKKSVALQARRQLSADVAPILGGSGASVTVLLTGQVSPMVAPVPSMGRANVGVQGLPLVVAKRPVIAAIPLPTVGWTGLPTTLVAPTVST